MVVAVTYDNGEIFQHFGHTELFKLYEIDNGEVQSSDVIDASGSGHEALAAFLKEKNVEVLICGGIGAGAQNALTECEIELYAGITGDADQAVEAYLRGEITGSGANCNHHEGASCEENGCGHCGGGCHAKPAFEGKNVGKTCRTHYEGTFNDGTVFDSSYDRGEPLEFVCGAGMMISGYDKAVANMEVGEIINVHLEPSEAYGESDPNAIFDVPLANLPGAEELPVGEQVYLQNAFGQPFPVVVVGKDDTSITFDANHEMAGKELNFKIELVEVID